MQSRNKLRGQYQSGIDGNNKAPRLPARIPKHNDSMFIFGKYVVMAKNFIKKYLPDPDSIKNHQSMQIFGKLLHDGNLWHLHRRSARGAFAAGLFAALMPMPGQTVLAAALAIIFRCNIPIAVALCWLPPWPACC